MVLPCVLYHFRPKQHRLPNATAKPLNMHHLDRVLRRFLPLPSRKSNKFVIKM